MTDKNVIKQAQEPTPCARCGGLEKHAIEMEIQRDHYRQRAQTMHEHQQGDVWYWQGDGEDHLESMINGLVVVIRADQLRELAAPKPQPMPVPQGCKLVPVEPTEEWVNNLASIQGGDLEEVPLEAIKECIEQMLAAAPEAPQPPDVTLTNEGDIAELEHETRLLRARAERLQALVDSIVPRLESACGKAAMPPKMIAAYIQEAL